MSNIPDFASASYPEIKAGAPSPASETETWMTNEQIPVPPTYSESVYDDCLHLDFTQTGQKCDSNFCILNIVARNGFN